VDHGGVQHVRRVPATGIRQEKRRCSRCHAPSRSEKIPREDDRLRDTPLFLVVVVVVVVAAVNGVMLGVVSIEKPNYTKSPRELSTW